MISRQHASHITSRVSHSDCSECRADTERRLAFTHQWAGYSYVREYLCYAKPRVAALKADKSADAVSSHREFIKAMHRRISARLHQPGRKRNDSYLERLRQFVNVQGHGPRFRADAGYLRQFARRGASALDWR